MLVKKKIYRKEKSENRRERKHEGNLLNPEFEGKD